MKRGPATASDVTTAVASTAYLLEHLAKILSVDRSKEISEAVTDELGKAFKPDRIVFVSALPKTRSAKIVRRAVRARVLGKEPGDLSSLENPEALQEIPVLDTYSSDRRT